MASIRRRRDKWQVQIRRKGRGALSRSFHVLKDAEEWARHMEVQADRGDLPADPTALTLQARDDLHHQWIYQAGAEALKAAGKSLGDPDVPGETLAELVRRGLLELNRRYRARLADDHGRSFFDQLFDPDRPAKLTFGKLADQHLRLIEENGAVNALSAKGLDRQRATVALVREIVGEETPVDGSYRYERR